MGENQKFDVTNPLVRLQQVSGDQVLLLDFETMESTDNGPQPTGLRVVLTMKSPDISIFLEKLALAQNPPKFPGQSH